MLNSANRKVDGSCFAPRLMADKSITRDAFAFIKNTEDPGWTVYLRLIFVLS